MKLNKRIEFYLSKLSGSGNYAPEIPVRRTEKIINYMLGNQATYPTPITRVERLIEACLINQQDAPFEPCNRLEKIIAGWDVETLTIEQALWKEVANNVSPTITWDVVGSHLVFSGVRNITTITQDGTSLVLE